MEGSGDYYRIWWPKDPTARALVLQIASWLQFIGIQHRLTTIACPNMPLGAAPKLARHHRTALVARSAVTTSSSPLLAWKHHIILWASSPPYGHRGGPSHHLPLAVDLDSLSLDWPPSEERDWAAARKGHEGHRWERHRLKGSRGWGWGCRRSWNEWELREWVDRFLMCIYILLLLSSYQAHMSCTDWYGLGFIMEVGLLWGGLFIWCLLKWFDRFQKSLHILGVTQTLYLPMLI